LTIFARLNAAAYETGRHPGYVGLSVAMKKKRARIFWARNSVQGIWGMLALRDEVPVVGDGELTFVRRWETEEVAFRDDVSAVTKFE